MSFWRFLQLVIRLITRKQIVSLRIIMLPLPVEYR